jgi:hypothetical protein
LSAGVQELQNESEGSSPEIVLRKVLFFAYCNS